MSTKYNFKPPFLTFLYDGENEGLNGSNSALTVEMWRNKGQCWPAVYAQEVYECRRKWKFWTWFDGGIQRELMGHAIECAVAREVLGLDDERFAEYEADEAAIIAWWYADIDESDPEKVLALMKEKRGDAIAWVDAHRGEVERWKEWLA